MKQISGLESRRFGQRCLYSDVVSRFWFAWSYPTSLNYKDKNGVYLKYQLTSKSYLYLDFCLIKDRGIIDCLGNMFIDKKDSCSGWDLIEDDSWVIKRREWCQERLGESAPKRQTKFQQGQKRAGKDPRNRDSCAEAERQEVTKNRVERTRVLLGWRERERKQFWTSLLISKCCGYPAGFLSILLLLSVLIWYLTWILLIPSEVLDEYVCKLIIYDWTYEDISQLQLQKKWCWWAKQVWTAPRILLKFGKKRSQVICSLFWIGTDGRMSLFYSREEPRQRLSFYFENK